MILDFSLVSLLMRVGGLSPLHLSVLLPSFSFLFSTFLFLWGRVREIAGSPWLLLHLLTIIGLMASPTPTRTKIQDFARVLSFASNLKKDKKHTRRTSRLGSLEWSRRYAKIRTAEGKVYSFKEVERDYQVTLLSDKHSRIIVGKSRQLGISNTCAFIAAEEAIAGGTVLVVSKNLEQAAQFLAYVYVALSDAPHPRFLKQNKYSLEFVGGGLIVCQPATKKAGRGIAATLVILDESAWQLYAREIYTAIVPTLSTTAGRLIVLSTPNGTGNLFQEQWDFAASEASYIENPQKRTWSVHFLPWWVNPAWDDAWAKKTKADMGEKEFAQEHEVDFAGSGQNVFSTEQIENTFKFGISEMPPVKGHSYINAFDLGRTRDGFAGFTIDISTTPFTVAHIEHHYKLDYTLQAKLIDAINRLYPGDTFVESNGPGDPLIQFLTTRVTPFFTTALNKKNIIDALGLLLDKQELRIPEHKPLKLQLTRYIRRDQSIEQDLVMALAIAAFHAGRPTQNFGVVSGGEVGPMSIEQIKAALKAMVPEAPQPQEVPDLATVKHTTTEDTQALAEQLVAGFRLGTGA